MGVKKDGRGHRGWLLNLAWAALGRKWENVAKLWTVFNTFVEMIISKDLLLTPEKAMAPHSSTFAWKIPWTEEPVGCSPWDREESDMTERLHFHFSLSCIGEGNGIPLQCSCLENPRDGGAWWAAVYGVAQNQTRLRRLSSSSRLFQILLACMSFAPLQAASYLN